MGLLVGSVKGTTVKFATLKVLIYNIAFINITLIKLVIYLDVLVKASIKSTYFSRTCPHTGRGIVSPLCATKKKIQNVPKHKNMYFGFIFFIKIAHFRSLWIWDTVKLPMLPRWWSLKRLTQLSPLSGSTSKRTFRDVPNMITIKRARKFS